MIYALMNFVQKNEAEKTVWERRCVLDKAPESRELKQVEETTANTRVRVSQAEPTGGAQILRQE